MGEQHGARENKMCTHLKQKIRHWIGDLFNAWGGENVSDDDIKNDWEAYAKNLLYQNENLPDFFNREIELLAEEFRATRNTVGQNGDARTINLSDDTSDDGNRDSYEFYWLDADDDMMVNNNNGDDDTV
eukprot:10214590-Ditylum_brightwellii.AAC.1